MNRAASTWSVSEAWICAPGILPVDAEGHGVDVVQAGGGDADEDHLVAEHGRIDRRRLFPEHACSE